MYQNNKNQAGLIWLLKMAWRDSRRSRSKLFLFISSIVLGISALVAISSFSKSLQSAINAQSKELLGADLVINSRQTQSAYTPAASEATYADEVSFASMAYFPKHGTGRLVNVRAIGNGFPFYGTFETQPENAGSVFRESSSVLVDNALLAQFNVRPGDSIKIGELTFLIKGILRKVPGQSEMFASIAPPVYIPIRYLEGTELLQKGSRYTWRRFIKFHNLPKSTEKRRQKLQKLEHQIEAQHKDYDVETIEERKKRLGRIFDNLTTFLNLTAFMALLLGCVGVASAITLYTKTKRSSIAVLRCLGVSGAQAFTIFLIQISTMGLLGALLGAILGNLVQQFLPDLFSSFLPLTIPLHFSWSANLVGIATGLVVSLLFALIPLVKIRKISPLRTLRASFEEPPSGDYLPYLLYFFVILFVFIFGLIQMGNWRNALLFTLALCVAFALLAATAAGLTRLLRYFFPHRWPYLWRQGLANLFRPDNQTGTLLVSVGLGTFLIALLLIIQQSLLRQLRISDEGGRANMVLFDIRPGQRQDLARMCESFDLPILQQVPIVGMRLEKINSTTLADVRTDSTKRDIRWVFRREFRVSYRDSLIATEKVLEGDHWRGRIEKPGDPIFVSLEHRTAQSMRVGLGDTLHFNVQGVILETLVGQIRSVNWTRVQTNFTVLFPVGVLEDAPQFHVIMTRTASEQQAGDFQRALLARHPNISVVNLSLILSTVDKVLGKITSVIRFMSLFTVFTGLLVLIGAISISRYQRMRESVILRTIGARKKQVLWINTIEYALLGTLAAFTGILLSLAAGWALSVFNFEVAFYPPFVQLPVVWATVVAITVLLGLFNSRETISRPPLEVLRNAED